LQIWEAQGVGFLGHFESQRFCGDVFAIDWQHSVRLHIADGDENEIVVLKIILDFDIAQTREVVGPHLRRWRWLGRKHRGPDRRRSEGRRSLRDERLGEREKENPRGNARMNAEEWLHLNPPADAMT